MRHGRRDGYHQAARARPIPRKISRNIRTSHHVPQSVLPTVFISLSSQVPSGMACERTTSSKSEPRKASENAMKANCCIAATMRGPRRQIGRSEGRTMTVQTGQVEIAAMMPIRALQRAPTWSHCGGPSPVPAVEGTVMIAASSGLPTEKDEYPMIGSPPSAGVASQTME